MAAFTDAPTFPVADFSRSGYNKTGGGKDDDEEDQSQAQDS